MKLGLLTSAKAWAGGITAGAFAEYAKPTIDYFLGIGATKLGDATGVPVPEAMVTGLSSLMMVALVGVVIHLIPNKETSNDPAASAGA